MYLDIFGLWGVVKCSDTVIFWNRGCNIEKFRWMWRPIYFWESRLRDRSSQAICCTFKSITQLPTYNSHIFKECSYFNYLNNNNWIENFIVTYFKNFSPFKIIIDCIYYFPLFLTKKKIFWNVLLLFIIVERLFSILIAN